MWLEVQCCASPLHSCSAAVTLIIFCAVHCHCSTGGMCVLCLPPQPAAESSAAHSPSSSFAEGRKTSLPRLQPGQKREHWTEETAVRTWECLKCSFQLHYQPNLQCLPFQLCHQSQQSTALSTVNLLKGEQHDAPSMWQKQIYRVNGTK